MLIKQLSYIVLLTFSTLFSALAADSRVIYGANECVPGQTTVERWKYLAHKMPTLLGCTRQDLFNQFGFHRPKWSSRKRQLKDLDEPIEYCIDEKEIEKGIFKCRIVEFEFFEGRVKAISIRDTLIK